MSEFTPRLKLPYPKEEDAPDVPKDIKALAEALDKAIQPPGTLRLTAVIALEEGWLPCEGQAINRTTFKALFEAIGTAYGAGDGVNTFNVPDYRERVLVGAATGTPRGAKGGEATHLLNDQESGLPGHTHHMESINAGGAQPSLIASGGKNYVRGDTAGGGGNNSLTSTTTGSFSFGIGVAGIVGGAQAAASAHNNMQPYTASPVWIKT